LDALSVQTALDGSRRIVWVIIGMIKAHPTQNQLQGKPFCIVVLDHRLLQPRWTSLCWSDGGGGRGLWTSRSPSHRDASLPVI
jgi:hypothetical protein